MKTTKSSRTNSPAAADRPPTPRPRARDGRDRIGPDPDPATLTAILGVRDDTPKRPTR
jgi:hypothetical protein